MHFALRQDGDIYSPTIQELPKNVLGAFVAARTNSSGKPIGPKGRRIQVRTQPQLTMLERLYLLLQRSALARFFGVAILSIPALFVLGMFWWNVRADADSALNSAQSISPRLLPDPRLAEKTAESTQFLSEFERQDGMLLGCNELVEYHPRVMTDMVRALHGKVEVYGLVNDSAQRQKVVSLLEQNGLPANAVEFVEIPAYGMWVRDFGPKFLRNKVGGLTMVDFAYLDRPATDGTMRTDDDKVPEQLAKMFRTSVVSIPLSMEGGNLLTNGNGVCISTSQIVAENSHRRYGMQEVAHILRDYFGQEQWASLEHLPVDNTRHADTFVMFTSPDTVVVASCDPKEDAASAAVMDKAAEQLSKINFMGKPLRVVRIPMTLKGDEAVRTYTNVVFANGTLLVPQYADAGPGMNEQALKIYRETMPGWNVVGIECLSVARKGGSLHCITCNVPSPSLAPLDLDQGGE